MNVCFLFSPPLCLFLFFLLFKISIYSLYIMCFTMVFSWMFIIYFNHIHPITLPCTPPTFSSQLSCECACFNYCCFYKHVWRISHRNIHTLPVVISLKKMFPLLISLYLFEMGWSLMSSIINYSVHYFWGHHDCHAWPMS